MLATSPMSDASIEEAGMWAMTRTLMLDEIANIALELEGPDEEESDDE